VEVLKDALLGWVEAQNEYALVDGAVYVKRTAWPLSRFTAPDLKREAFTEKMPWGGVHRLALFEGRFHVVGEDNPQEVPDPLLGQLRSFNPSLWSTVDADGKNPRLVASGLPPIRGVYVSSHFGLVAIVEDPSTRSRALRAVEVLEPAPKK
jgi:hypothetical protein